MTTPAEEPQVETPPVMFMVVTMKGGAQLRIPVEKFSTDKNIVTGELIKLNWTKPAGYTTALHFLDLDQVAALHAEMESPS